MAESAGAAAGPMESRACAATSLRQAHGAWKRAIGRADPLAILRASDAYRACCRSAMAGCCRRPSTFLSWRCRSDADLGQDARDANSGPGLWRLPSAELRRFRYSGAQHPFRYNDFDETLPARWEWDVKRFVASFVLAGRGAGRCVQDSARPALGPALPSRAATHRAATDDRESHRIAGRHRGRTPGAYPEHAPDEQRQAGQRPHATEGKAIFSAPSGA